MYYKCSFENVIKRIKYYDISYLKMNISQLHLKILFSEELLVNGECD